MTAAAPASFVRQTPIHERLVEAFLFLSAAVGILTTVGIVAVLAFEAVEFFRAIPALDYLTGTVWSASIKPFRFGVLPLVTGTLLVAGLALVIAIPLGLLSGVYLAEYASPRVRTTLKPILELIAGIPTVVLGYFAINFISPVLLKALVPGIGGFSVLAGGIVVGILVTPLIATLSEDAMRAVPGALREGAVAMGATRFETVRRVVVPAALSGIMASIILAMSRAVGETMAVVLAVGANPQLTFDVRESVQTMTAFIVQISLGDTPAGSLQFKALFAVGATLFLITLALNLLSDRVVARFRNHY
ncbi:MAG: phosphate ABC transporter permease subunit PstC [Chloroflexota bacterium]